MGEGDRGHRGIAGCLEDRLTASGPREGGQPCLHDGGKGEATIGTAADEDATAVHVQILRARLEEDGRRGDQLASHQLRRFRDGVARHHHAPAREGADAEGNRRRVPAHDGDVGGRDAKRISDDLRIDRLVSLALRAGARRHQHLAGRVEPDHGAFVGTDAGALHVGGDAHAAIHSPASKRRLLIADRPVAQGFKRRLKGGVEVPAIIDKWIAVPVEHPDVVRHLVHRDEVAPAHVGGIDPGRSCQPIDHAVHHEDGLGPPRPPIGRMRRLVSYHALPLEAGMGDTKGAEHVTHRVVRLHDAPGVVHALVEEEAVVQGENDAVPRRGQPHVVQLLPRMGRALQMLPARLHPLDGPAEPHGGHGDQHVLGIDGALGAESAAYVGRDHPHPVSSEAEPVDQGLLHEVRELGGGPHGDAAVTPVRDGEHGAGLEGHARVALHGDALRDDHRRVPERGLRVPDLGREAHREVVGPVVVNAGRVRTDAGLDVHDHR